MLFSFSLPHTSVFADIPPSPSQTSETDLTSSCKNYVSVLLPLPLPAPLTYLKPCTLDLHAGDIVSVPLGKKQKLGVVWEPPSHLPPDLAPPTPPPLDDTHRLRAVLAKQDYPPLPEELRRFIDWVAAYTLSAPGLVMAMALRPLLQKGINSLSPPTGWRLAPQQPQTLRLTSARQNVLRVLADGIVRSTAELARCAQTSASVIHGLANAGALHAVPLLSQASFEQPNPYHCPPILEGQQYEAATTLRRSVCQKGFSVTLLEGVTGAGKTEIYQEAIAACLENHQQVLVLLPEIALSAQWIERFKRRFGVRPALWHSDVGHKNRRLIWTEAAHGRVSVVAGARSALFSNTQAQPRPTPICAGQILPSSKTRPHSPLQPPLCSQPAGTSAPLFPPKTWPQIEKKKFLLLKKTALPRCVHSGCTLIRTQTGGNNGSVRELNSCFTFFPFDFSR